MMEELTIKHKDPVFLEETLSVFSGFVSNQKMLL